MWEFSVGLCTTVVSTPLETRREACSIFASCRGEQPPDPFCMEFFSLSGSRRIENGGKEMGKEKQTQKDRPCCRVPSRPRDKGSQTSKLEFDPFFFLICSCDVDIFIAPLYRFRSPRVTAKRVADAGGSRGSFAVFLGSQVCVCLFWTGAGAGAGVDERSQEATYSDDFCGLLGLCCLHSCHVSKSLPNQVGRGGGGGGGEFGLNDRGRRPGWIDFFL